MVVFESRLLAANTVSKTDRSLHTITSIVTDAHARASALSTAARMTRYARAPMPETLVHIDHLARNGRLVVINSQ